MTKTNLIISNKTHNSIHRNSSSYIKILCLYILLNDILIKLPTKTWSVRFSLSVQFSSVQSLSRVRLNRSTPALPVHHQLLEFTQTHAHQVGNAWIQLIKYIQMTKYHFFFNTCFLNEQIRTL